MTAPTPQPLNHEPRPSGLAQVSDFWAYVIPMAIFMGFVWLGGQNEVLYPISYILRAILVAIALVVFWPKYTKVRWNYWWLGMIVGAVGIVQWVGMQLFLQHHFKFFQSSGDAFDPSKFFDGRPVQLWGFVVIRIASAVLVVPVMEELFWRDFLWRSIIAPNDFKLAQVGEWDWKAFLTVSGAFASVHGNWWLTAIVWGMMVAGLLVWTKSLGACMIAHGVTNLLLAVYVLQTHDWSFW